MDRQQLDRISNKLKEWFFLLKNDPEAFAEVRKLALGILVCAAVLYGGSSLFLEPRQKALAKKIKQKAEIEASAPAQLTAALAAQIAKLSAEKRNLEEERDILALQVLFGEEHWRAHAGQDRFAKTVFTLRSDTPSFMEKRLKKMNRLADRSANGFTLSTVHLAGEAPFSEILTYLRTLESKAEVTVIDELELTRLPGTPANQQAMVAFSLVVGNTTLETSP